MDWKIIIFLVLLLICLITIGNLAFHLYKTHIHAKRLMILLQTGYKKDDSSKFIAPDGWKTFNFDEAAERAELQQKVAKYELGDSKILLEKFTHAPKTNKSKSELAAWLKNK